MALLEPRIRAARQCRLAGLEDGVPRLRARAAARAAGPQTDDVGHLGDAAPGATVLRRAVFRGGAPRAGARAGREGRRVRAREHGRGSRALGVVPVRAGRVDRAAAFRRRAARRPDHGRARLDARLGARDRALAPGRPYLRRAHGWVPGVHLDARLLAAREDRRRPTDELELVAEGDGVRLEAR